MNPELIIKQLEKSMDKCSHTANEFLKTEEHEILKALQQKNIILNNINCPNAEAKLIESIKNIMIEFAKKYASCRSQDIMAKKLIIFDKKYLSKLIELFSDNCQKEHKLLEEDLDLLFELFYSEGETAPSSQDSSQHSSLSSNDDNFEFSAVFDNEYNTEQTTSYNTQALGSIATDNGYGQYI
jgi:hypothetical protein